MKKSRNCEKELTDIQRLKEQRDFYKEQYEKLKKLVDRLNVDEANNPRLKPVNEFISSQEVRKVKAEKEKKWKCHKCEKGFLKMLTIPQGPSNLVYFRKCTNAKCTHKLESNLIQKQ